MTDSYPPTPLADRKFAVSEFVIPQILTPSPSHSSGEGSPELCAEDDLLEPVITTQKKKKKKKAKKSAKAKEPSPSVDNKNTSDVDGRPALLCISRNKHWRYISSYHGPWLQLPLELLESLLILNLDPATLSAPEARLPPFPSNQVLGGRPRPRDRGFKSLKDYSPPDSPPTFAPLPPPPSLPIPQPGQATPPPIDPGVFRSVTSIRRLIDEAAELSVRASSGLSAAALSSIRGTSGINPNSPWAAVTQLGLNPMGDNGGGRNVAMSATRVHRLRSLAVQKLAQAYRTDEIASSVMVMQGGSVFDDIAERVLKHDPTDLDAKYVHFFHEKIPSRQLAESTSTAILDELIAALPQHLEFYRTRGIVHCFRDEYSQATKDFTFALKEARVRRKARTAHRNNSSQSESRTKHGKKKKGTNKLHGQAPHSGTSALDTSVDGPDGEPLLLHPSVLPDAPDPLEPQLLFLRGAAYLQHAVFLIEEAVLKLEDVCKCPTADGAEFRICYIEDGKYGGIENGHPDGPLGKKGGPKQLAYSSILADSNFKAQVVNLVRKALRDHERFQAHFDALESPDSFFEGNMAECTEYAFLLSESIRPGNYHNTPSYLPDTPAMFMTYHPLLVESYFTVLLCLLMLADFTALLPAFHRTAAIVDGLEGYPIFLPPRSMAQAELVEILERLASSWKTGAQLHSLSRSNGKLAIEAPPSPPVSSTEPPSPTLHDFDLGGPSTSTAAQGCGASSTPSGRSPPTSTSDRARLVENLDYFRMLLAPVRARQKQRSEKATAEKATGNNKKSLNINLPLHGPRVEIILAWLAAVHLVEFESVA